MPTPQAQLQVLGGYEWTVDLDAADRGSGASGPDSATETGSNTALPIDGAIPSAAIYDGGTAAADWSFSGGAQHFVMSAQASGYGLDTPSVEDWDGYSDVTVYVQSIFTDYITNTSAAPVKVLFTYALDTVSPPEGNLEESGCSWQVGGTSGTIDFTSTGGAGTASYSATIAAGQTVTWYTNYQFEGQASWGYDPPPYGGGFTGSPLSYDASATGIVHADEFNGSGNPVAGNPDLSFASGIDFSSVACFAAGARVLTAAGEVAVDALRVGDLVVTLLGRGLAPVVWLGHRQVDCARHPRPGAVWPIRVQAGAISDGVPHRDLWLSPEHAVLIRDGAVAVLVPIRHLLNGTTIAQVARESITYWHVELARHDAILVEGLPAETYLDTGNRSDFANGGPEITVHPTFADAVWRARACAPQLRHGDALVALQRRLADRAAPMRRNAAYRA
jgi:hypothetical protein